MDRTLITPSMIETYRACPRAFELAMSGIAEGAPRRSLPSICKGFILRGLAEINRGRLISTADVQKYMGQQWPVEKLEKLAFDRDHLARAFLHAYKALIQYVERPYRPEGTEIAAVALKLRARVPHVRVYVEDTFDLILWHPQKRHLELVEFQLRATKPFNPAWPKVSVLVKHHLSQKLKSRWDVDSISMTIARLNPKGLQTDNYMLDETLLNLHWQELVRDLEAMKTPSAVEPHTKEDSCRFCQTLQASLVKESMSEPPDEESNGLSLSA